MGKVVVIVLELELEQGGNAQSWIQQSLPTSPLPPPQDLAVEKVLGCPLSWGLVILFVAGN